MEDIEVGGPHRTAGEVSIRVRWSGTGDVSGELCIATNDPDQPVQTLDMTSNDDSSVLIGEPAPDFALVGVDGETYTLSSRGTRC